MKHRNTLRRPKLSLESLELRENPAGSITTSYVGGMLIITGTDQAEDFTIKSIAGGAFTLTGNSGTLIDGSPAENTLPVTSVRMILKGGDDIVTADPTAAFNVAGALIIDGGDGNNTVQLTTTASAVTLGSFTYTGGEGSDSVSIGQSGTASTVMGAVAINTGNGGSTITLTNLVVGGELTHKAGIGDDTLTLDTVTAGKNINVNTGLGNGTFSATTTTVTGGLSFNALNGVSDASLSDVTVKGKTGIVMNNSNGDANLSTTFTNKVQAGGVSVVGKNGGSIFNINGGSLSVFGDVRVANKTISSQSSGTLNVSNLNFSAGDLLSVVGVGVWNVRKNLTLAATSPVGQINTASFDQLTLGGALTSTSSLYQMVEFNRGVINGAVSLNSLRGSAGLLHTSIGDLEFKKGISVLANGDASVVFASSGQAKVAGNIVATSTASTAAFRNTAGKMILSGGVRVSAFTNADVVFTSTDATGGTIAKDVTATARNGAVNVNAGAVNLTLNGKLTATGATDAQLGGSSTGTLRFLKDVAITGSYGDSNVAFTGNGSTAFGGKLTISGGNNAIMNLIHSGSSSTFLGDVSLLATTGRAQTLLGGIGKTFSGNFLLRGIATTLSLNSSSGIYTFAKKLTVLGSNGFDSIQLGGAYSVLGDTMLNLGDGGSAVILGGTNTGTEFAGNLNITTGNSADTVTFVNVHTSKNVMVNTLGGNDVLYVDGGTVFGGAFTADTGAGDDILDIGRGSGLPVAAATFTGKATIKAGSGNDVLSLGRSAGDGNSLAVFSTGGSTIDGGTGFNSYDDAAGQGLVTPNLNLTGF